MSQTEKRTLSVDPGYDRVGFAIVSGKASSPAIIHSECFETNRKSPHGERLALIAKRVKEIIKKWHPSELAIEELFFSQNRTTAIKVAEARGVIIATCASEGMPAYEYHPTTVKLSVSGYGRASKEQMERFIERTVKMPPGKKKDDEYDAVAVGIAHLASQK